MWKQKSWMMIDSFYNNIIALFGLHIFTIYNNNNKKTVFYGLIYSYIVILNWIKQKNWE